MSGARRTLRAIFLGSALLCGPAVGQGAGHGVSQPPSAGGEPGPSQDDKWRRRYPQPVLVLDLIGRKIITREQGVLGRIETLVSTQDGEVLIVFSKRRLLVLRGDTVAVPMKAAALLGQFVMVLDVSEEEIGKLPPFEPARTVPVDRASRISMGLTKH